MKRLHDHFGAFFRFAVGGDALVSWHSSYSDPTARMFRIAQTYEGGLLIWLMGIIGIVVMADVIINDCTPDRIRIGAREFPIRWKRAFKYRHFIFVALALCYATHPFIAEKVATRYPHRCFSTGTRFSTLVWHSLMPRKGQGQSGGKEHTAKVCHLAMLVSWPSVYQHGCVRGRER